MEQERNEKLFEVGNLLHESVPVSNDEVCDGFKASSLLAVWKQK